MALPTPLTRANIAASINGGVNIVYETGPFRGMTLRVSDGDAGLNDSTIAGQVVIAQGAKSANSKSGQTATISPTTATAAAGKKIVVTMTKTGGAQDYTRGTRGQCQIGSNTFFVPTEYISPTQIQLTVPVETAFVYNLTPITNGVPGVSAALTVS